MKGGAHMVMADKTATVRRITVDERLSEDLIRLEICELIKHEKSGEFKDEPDYWRDIAREGGEVLARPITPGKKSTKECYIELMSIPKSQIKKFQWKDLKEGQVFLSGAFEAKEEQSGDKKVIRYFVRPDKMSFKQIDDDVKKNTKTLYYEILAKGEKHGRL